MKNIDIKKLVYAIEIQGIVAMVLDMGGWYSVRCEWSLDNSLRDIREAEEEARIMLKEAVGTKRRHAAAARKIAELASEL